MARASSKKEQEAAAEAAEVKKAKEKKVQANIQRAKIAAQTAMRLKVFEEEGRDLKTKALVMLQGHVRRFILRKFMRGLRKKEAALQAAVADFGVKHTEQVLKSMTRKDVLVAREEGVRKVAAKDPDKRTAREVKQLAEMLSRMNCFQTDALLVPDDPAAAPSEVGERLQRLETLTNAMRLCHVSERQVFTESSFHLLRRVYDGHQAEHEVLSEHCNCFCVVLTGCLLGLECEEPTDLHGWEKKPSDEKDAEQQLLEQRTVMFKAGQSFNTKTLRLMEPCSTMSWGQASTVTMLLMQAHQYKWFTRKQSGDMPRQHREERRKATSVAPESDADDASVQSADAVNAQDQ
jgi:hypothetical protein